MKEFTVRFYKNNKLVCTCTIKAETPEEAILNAEFRLVCKYSNVEYDEVEV